MKKVYIMGACRTPIGKMGGCLSSISCVDLGSIVIKEALNRTGILEQHVDHVYMGCVIQAGLGQNVARQASIKAGLPFKFARHGRALTGASPEHAQIVGSV